MKTWLMSSVLEVESGPLSDTHLEAMQDPQLAKASTAMCATVHTPCSLPGGPTVYHSTIG